MKPIKLTALENAVQRRTDIAETTDWIFQEKEGDRIPATQFRLNVVLPQPSRAVDFVVRLPVDLQRKLVDAERVAVHHSTSDESPEG